MTARNRACDIFKTKVQNPFDFYIVAVEFIHLRSRM